MTIDLSYKPQPCHLPDTPIVLLHGWGMNKNIWQPFVASLPAALQARIQTLDLPGFGDNNLMPAQYDLPSLSAWLDQQISTPSIVLGWSLGGLLALHFASNYADKVVRVGLIASSAKFMTTEDWPGIKPEILNAFSEQLMLNHQQTIERFLAIQAMGANSARQDIKHIRDIVLQSPTPNLTALQQGLLLLQQTDLRPQLQALTMPVLGIFGRLDALVPVSAVALLNDLKPSAEFTVLDKASHAPFISHAEEFSVWFQSAVN